MIPVADPDAVAQLEQILELNLADDTQSWSLAPDGTWHRIPTVIGVATQEILMATALERSSFLDDPPRARTTP
jgi:polyphosphate kinase